MELYSTRYHDRGQGSIGELSQMTLAFEIKRAVRISIISAYYSIDFLQEILSKVNKTIRNKCLLELVFNGFSGERLEYQKADLLGLKYILKGLGFRNISILLNRNTTLFHTKLYFITNDKGSFWYSGSANASIAAFETNEEILVKSNSKIREVKHYITRVIENSIAIEKIILRDIKESNIIGFFRTGSIYFKPTSQISFTFSELNLPDWVESKLAEVLERPAYSNTGKAWGAYNMKFSLGLFNDEETEQKSQLRLKPWSVETCFGYWVPNRYTQIVNRNIDEKSNHRKANLRNILNLMQQRGIDSLALDYKSYLSDVRRILAENELVWEIEESCLLEKFTKFAERIILKLSDETKLDKLCRPLVSTGMPEIWEDNLVYDDFSESFFEYISGCLYERHPLIVRSMKKHFKLERQDDSDKIKSRFHKYFNSEAEWSDDYWQLK